MDRTQEAVFLLTMTTHDARALLTAQLTVRYGAGEAASIARIVLEDGFHSRNRPGKEPWPAPDTERLYAMVERLAGGEPVQYVLGEADFFGLKFRVNPAVLIPRQETEELVAWILEFLPGIGSESPTLLDIGLGSGCIGITLKRKYPRLQLYGLEKSPEALTVAVENARRILGEQAVFTFLEGDVLNYPDWGKLPEFDVVASNPPYIPFVEKSMMPEHVTAHEPALALFVEDADPLLFYRVIAGAAWQKLRTGGALFFECNEFNAGEVARLVSEKGFAGVELRRDLAGAERMVRGLKP